jgi:hypothetical protein
MSEAKTKSISMPYKEMAGMMLNVIGRRFHATLLCKKLEKKKM